MTDRYIGLLINTQQVIPLLQGGALHNPTKERSSTYSNLTRNPVDVGQQEGQQLLQPIKEKVI